MNIKEIDDRLREFTQEHGAVLLGMHAELTEFKGQYGQRLEGAIDDLSARADRSIGGRLEQISHHFDELREQANRKLRELSDIQENCQLQLQKRLTDLDALQKGVRDYIVVQQKLLDKEATTIQHAQEQVLHQLRDLERREAEHRASVTRFIHRSRIAGLIAAVVLVVVAIYLATRS